MYNPMMLPLFDYADIVWGDRDNKVLMKSLQILQNKVAKAIRCAQNPTGQDHVAARLPPIIHGFLVV